MHKDENDGVPEANRDGVTSAAGADVPANRSDAGANEAAANAAVPAPAAARLKRFTGRGNRDAETPSAERLPGSPPQW